MIMTAMAMAYLLAFAARFLSRFARPKSGFATD
jgi:hypothetical protein